MVDELTLMGATPDTPQSRYAAQEWHRRASPVPREMALTIFVNGEELVTVLCTPTKLTPLVVGFLYSEGIISAKTDVASMRVCEEESLADVRLGTPGYSRPERRTLASGCGGGVSFTTRLRAVDSRLVVTADEVLLLVRELNRQAHLYRTCGGVHTSALADRERLLVVAEDIGRHNTLDKITGECLLAGMPTRDRLLLTTGRISSEMLSKAAQMQTPIVVSRSSPTDRAISLAREAGITLVGYARGDRLSVYTHEERLQGAPSAT